ncbi:MAG: hypothetical protein JRG74_10680 [Deltaproteobacteria bacterium]|nr:hypothetical protein [Deltaproteobacteria bacterium]
MKGSRLGQRHGSADSHIQPEDRKKIRSRSAFKMNIISYNQCKNQAGINTNKNHN